MGTPVLLRVVETYRYWISPLLGRNCRFYPSCSEYCAEALHHHGAARGLWLSFGRLLRCGPWHPGGYDPVPGIETATSAHKEHS